MHFEAEHIYHVYNRGNNRAIIFFSSKNYLYLLQKIKKEWLAYYDIYSYCLMPNHFHFMLQPKKEGCEPIVLKDKTMHLQKLSKAIGKTLSSYTQAINIQNNTTGNLFQKKTKAKCISEPSILEPPYNIKDYLVNCFFYIHNNPLAANITDNLKQWPYLPGQIIMDLETAHFAIYSKPCSELVSVKLILKIRCTKNQIKK